MNLEMILLVVLLALNLTLLFAFVLRKHKVSGLDELGGKVQNLHVDLAQKFVEGSGNQILKTQEKLGQELNLFRDVLNKETHTNRVESRQILLEVTKSLEARFESFQKSSAEKLELIRGEVDKKLSETVSKNFESFGQVSKRLEELQSVTSQVIVLSQGVKDLSRILESPKLRGEMGEFQLGEMLRQVLPADCFEEQFIIDTSLKDRVDAVIKLKEGYLCIDSKFPLDNARRLFDESIDDAQRKSITKDFAGDVKVMVDSIAKKYIIPDKTLDFALMFVPAEVVFHELLRNSELHTYCLKKHVIPVSPNSFYAYLQAIAVGFRGLKIQAEAKKIEATLGKLRKDFELFGADFQKVGRHLKDASTQYSNVENRVDRIGKVIDKLGIESAPLTELPPTGLPPTIPAP